MVCREAFDRAKNSLLSIALDKDLRQQNGIALSVGKRRDVKTDLTDSEMQLFAKLLLLDHSG